jgi:hypothetical protein
MMSTDNITLARVTIEDKTILGFDVVDAPIMDHDPGYPTKKNHRIRLNRIVASKVNGHKWSEDDGRVGKSRAWYITPWGERIKKDGEPFKDAGFRISEYDDIFRHPFVREAIIFVMATIKIRYGAHEEFYSRDKALREAMANMETEE